MAANAPRVPLDVLRLPVIGAALRHRNGRLLLQIPFLALALLMLYDGFTGPQNAAQNLATVGAWVHYRGLVVIALLMAGNLFCMGCPFTLPRTLARRWVRPKRRFPARLRNKWTAIAGLAALFFAYEWLNMWASPLLTAWVIVAYFAASFILEALFDESPFCKYVCPLGSFNFAYSTGAPLQITAKNPDVCKSCVGKECVNGSFSSETIIRVDEIGDTTRTVVHGRRGVLGCGTELFVPTMKSNMDCVLCLDCARACPHDNVALSARMPFKAWFDPAAWPKRWDVTLLIVILAAFGIVNAFGMTPPVYQLIEGIAGALGMMSGGEVTSAGEAVALALIFGVLGVALPVLAVRGAAYMSRKLANTKFAYTDRDVAAAFTPAFVPLGFAVWIAHYGFHFLTGALTIVPVFQNFLIDHGVTFLGEPDLTLSGMTDTALIGVMQFAVVVGGMGLSLLIAERAASRLYKRRAMPGLIPFALLLLVMMLAALFVFTQPMEMRGTALFN
jgi:polyferredoxin